MAHCTAAPWLNAYVLSVAVFPNRAAVVISTRRPHSYLTEIALGSAPATSVGVSIPTKYSATQLFVNTNSETGSERVIAVLEDRTIDVYTWSGGGSLLFRHVARGVTLDHAAIRIAMASLREHILFMVPLMRIGEKSRSVATEPLPSSRLYYAVCHPDEVLLDSSENRLCPSKPASRVYYFNCFQANNGQKHTPYIDTSVPVIGLKVHPAGVPLLAVLCADAALRLYDLDSGRAKDGEPVLYNVVSLTSHCQSLQLPSFSKLWVNGDGTCKVFDFVPTPSSVQNVRAGKGEGKMRKVYTNTLIAVADCRKIVVLDLTVPGTSHELYFAMAPPKVDYLGVVCEPLGTTRSSGLCSTAERDAADDYSTHGSRRLIWAFTGQGLLEPLTMDDDLSAAGKLLTPAEWVPPVPLFAWAASGTSGEYVGRSVDSLSLPEAMEAMYGPTVCPGPASTARGSDAQSSLGSSVRVAARSEVVSEWSSHDALKRLMLRNQNTSPLSLLPGKALRMLALFHPRLPYLVVTTPVEGTFTARRLPSMATVASRRRLSLQSVSSMFSPPASATSSPNVLANGRSPSVVIAAPPFAYLADARGGVSVLRIVAVESSLVANVVSADANTTVAAPAEAALLRDASSDGSGGLAPRATLLCELRDPGQIAVSSLTVVPLPHLGAMPSAGGSASDAMYPSARYCVVAVTYVATSANRTLLGHAVPRVFTVFCLLDQNMISSSPAGGTDIQLPTRQRVCAASGALRSVRVLADTSAASWGACETTAPCLLLRLESAARQPAVGSNAAAAGGSWRRLDLTLLTQRHVEGGLSDALTELVAVPCPVAKMLSNASATIALSIEDTCRVAPILESALTSSSGRATQLAPTSSLTVAYSGSSGSIAVQSRRVPGAFSVAKIDAQLDTVECLAACNRFASSLRSAHGVLLAAFNRAADDSVCVAVATVDRYVRLIAFAQEDSSGQRDWRLLSSHRVDAVPAAMAFFGPLLVLQFDNGSVQSLTSAATAPRPLVTLPQGSHLVAIGSDRVVAVAPSARRVERRADGSLGIIPPEITVGHCCVPFLGPVVVAELDYAFARLNAKVSQDAAALAVNAAATVAAIVQNLPAQAPFATLGVLIALGRAGFHCLVADMVGAQSNVVADNCLALQPSALRSVTTQQLPRHTAAPLTAAIPAAEALDFWPVSMADTFLLHAERARQFTAVRHHQDSAGALVVTDGPATIVKKGAHAAVVSSSTLGMPAAAAALHQISWASGNERGQYAFDLLVVIASHVPFAALPPDTAKALETVIFSHDAAAYRAYRVVCQSFGSASPAACLFADNCKAARNGRRIPRIISVHHVAADQVTASAKKEVTQNIEGAADAFKTRDSFMTALRAKASDVRLGSGDVGRLWTVSFAVHRGVMAAFGGDDLSNTGYTNLRTLLTQSSLNLWPQVSLTQAEEAADDADVAKLAMAGNSTVDHADNATSVGGGGGADGRSAVGSTRTGNTGGLYNRSQPAPSVVGASAAPRQSAVTWETPHSGAAGGGSAVDAAQPMHGTEGTVTLAEQQQRALREEYLESQRGKAPRSLSKRNGSSSSSSDDDGAGKFEIKLRDAPSGAVTTGVDVGAVSFTSARLGAPTSTTADHQQGRRRIGGRDGGGAGVPLVDPDDVLASAFSSFEGRRYSDALRDFTTVRSLLSDGTSASGETTQGKLQLIAQYHLACAIQVYLDGPDAAALSPRHALSVAVHCVHLRLANEHVGQLIVDALQQTVLLTWQQTSMSLLDLLRFTAPEALDTHEGQELADQVTSLPVVKSDGGDDDLVYQCLLGWRMCSASFALFDERDIGSLIACAFCGLRFAPQYVYDACQTRNTPSCTCPCCGTGQLQVSPSFKPHAQQMGPKRIAQQHPAPAAAPPAIPAGVPAAPEVPRPAPAPARDVLDDLFGPAAPSVGTSHRFGSSAVAQPGSAAATVAAPPPSAAGRHVDPFADFPTATPSQPATAAAPAPAAAPAAAGDDMDVFF